MFSRSQPQKALTPGEAALLERAAGLLGVTGVKPRPDGAELRVLGRRRTLATRRLRGALLDQNTAAPPPVAAIALAELLGINPPAELLADFQTVRARLRPRLIHPRELTGPRRAMCRRDALDSLLKALAVGGGRDAPLITTPVLDRWPVDFDDALVVALDNLRRAVGPEQLHVVDGAPGVLALIEPREQAASAALAIDGLIPDHDPALGAVFSVPHDDVLLLLPVEDGGGVDALAAMVQASHSMAAGSERPLSNQLFWWTGARSLHLPMTCVEESGSRRVHLEAQGPIEGLLRILGTID